MTHIIQKVQNYLFFILITSCAIPHILLAPPETMVMPPPPALNPINAPAKFPAATPAGKPAPNAPELSKEDAQFFEAVEQQISSYVSALPPEEQKKFWEDVEVETAKISKMGEQELMEYLETIEKSLTEEPVSPAIAAPTPQFPILAPAEQKTEEKPRPTVSADKQKSGLNLLNAILTHINTFLSKTQSMVELPGKIGTWAKEGKLKNWPASLTWNVTKNQIEELAQKLTKLKDRDPKTNLYKYMDDFIRDEALQNNLHKLNDTLAKNVPLIEIAEFGLDKMSPAGRQAVRDILMALQEAHSLVGIPQALNAIFEKYEPTAKKIKETEETQQRQAYEGSKAQRTAAPSTTGGTPTERHRGHEATPDYGREQIYHYVPSYDYPYYPGAAPAQEETQKRKTPSAAAPEEKKPTPTKPSEKAKREESKDASDIAKNFDDALFEFQDLIEHTKNLEKFETHMKSAAPVDQKLLDAIPKATGAISKATRHAKRMKRLIAEDYPEAQKKEFRTKIRKGYQDYKFLLDKISGDINTVDGRLPAYTQMPPTQPGLPAPQVPLKAQKAWAYFGGSGAIEVDDAVKQAVTAPVQDMSELRERIQELKKVVNEL